MTNSLWSHRPASRVLAGIFSAMLLLSSLAACNLEAISDNSSGQASQNASTIEETLPAATEDPSLKGEGSVSLLEKLGSQEKGFLFSGASWFTSREEYLSALSAIWPDVGQGELTTEYEDSSSGVYLTQGMAQFTDFACPAAFRITETGGQVRPAPLFSLLTSPKRKRIWKPFYRLGICSPKLLVEQMKMFPLLMRNFPMGLLGMEMTEVV